MLVPVHVCQWGWYLGRLMRAVSRGQGNRQARLHMRHLRASLRARPAIVAAPPILPLVGPPIVGTPIALALALFLVFQPLLPPRGHRLQPIELAIETVAVRGQGGQVAAPGPR